MTSEYNNTQQHFYQPQINIKTVSAFEYLAAMS